METPKHTRHRPTHTPTPKLSDRKKTLFSATKKSSRSPISEVAETDIMDGLQPLDFESAIVVQNRLKSSLRPRVKKFSENIADLLKSNDRVPLSLLGNSNTPELLISPRSSAKTIATRKITKEETKKSLDIHNDTQLKTPSPPLKKSTGPDELGTLFKDTLNLRSHVSWKPTSHDSSCEMSDEEIVQIMNSSNRHKRTSEKASGDSPKSKQPKLMNMSPKVSPTIEKKTDPNSNTDSPSSNKNLIVSIDQFSISAKSFYSSRSTSAPTTPKSDKPRISLLTNTQMRQASASGSGSKKPKGKSRTDLRLGRNVSHKVRRPTFKPTPQTIDTILQSLNGEKFKKLLENRMYKKKVEEVHKIMKKNSNPIELSRPLNVEATQTDEDEAFSDIEVENENDFVATTTKNLDAVASNAAEIEKQSQQKPRKFFKSKGGSAIPNAFTINNVRGTVKDGRVSLLPTIPKIRGRKSVESAKKMNFAVEQAAVNDIIDMLDSDLPVENQAPESMVSSYTPTLHDNVVDDEDEDEFAEFRKRIPYKTSDPEMIEQQKLLLEFLISYQICTEKNFEIFIIDPDNHKDEAARIVDNLVIVEPVPTQDDEIFSETSESINLNFTDSQEADNFRKRLPYRTTDPIVAEQQKTLLEFLIKNQICTEEHFEIFIAEPEKHRDKASTILQNYMIPNGSADGQNELKLVLQTDEDNCMTVDPFSETLEIPSSYVPELTFQTSHTTLESMMSDDDESSHWRELSPIIPPQDPEENDIENVENRSNNPTDNNLFPIFYMGSKIKPIENQPIKRKPPKTFVGGFGVNQYQIDAGQKEFGAKQCPKCGLVYTAHEPEEEQLHSIYHKSLSILKFKGWIDEDAIEFLPEWGSGGRIIRLTHNIHPKRMERIIDILNIIDKELGIVSNTIPTPFTAYMAIKRNEIVGFCMVQPIKSASRYICMNGVDCCTEETFDVKCGVSRIWVSPLNRGCKIATKLIEIVRHHAIPGMELAYNDIAFSSPTQDGKLFAQCVTKRKDFLIYQSF